MNINILDWINRSNHKEIAEELLLGPQEEILRKLQDFNTIYDLNLGITKQFKWKPGTYKTYKEGVNRIQQFHKRCNSLQRIHFRIGDTSYRLNRMKNSIADIESILWSMRNQNCSFQDNTEQLEIALGILQRSLEDNKEFECRIKNNEDTKTIRRNGFKNFQLIIKINGDKLYLKTQGADNPVMTYVYPYTIKCKLTTGLNNFLNTYMASIAHPDKRLTSLNVKYTSKMYNNIYRLKHPYINRGWQNSDTGFDEHGNSLNWIYSCMGNMQTDMTALFVKFDLSNLKWLFEKWNSNFVFNVTNPLNNTKTLYHGHPKFITEDYEVIRGKNNPEECTYRSIYESIPLNTEHYCDKYECQLRNDCTIYNTYINLKLTPEEEALIYEISLINDDDINELIKAYKTSSNAFCSTINQLMLLIEITDPVINTINLVIDEYYELVQDLQQSQYLSSTEDRFLRANTRVGIMWDVTMNVCHGMSGKHLHSRMLLPTLEEKVRLNTIYKNIHWDMEDLCENVGFDYPYFAYDPPFPKAEEELKKRYNKKNNISPSNRPLPLNWAEYFHNNNRRPV